MRIRNASLGHQSILGIRFDNESILGIRFRKSDNANTECISRPPYSTPHALSRDTLDWWISISWAGPNPHSGQTYDRTSIVYISACYNNLYYQIVLTLLAIDLRKYIQKSYCVAVHVMIMSAIMNVRQLSVILGSTVVSPYVGMARKQNGGYNASISVQTLIFHLVVDSTRLKTVRSALWRCPKSTVALKLLENVVKVTNLEVVKIEFRHLPVLLLSFFFSSQPSALTRAVLKTKHPQIAVKFFEDVPFELSF